MKRTHVYLTDKQKLMIESLAGRHRTPEAEVIRALIDAGLKAHADAQAEHAAPDYALLDLVQLGERLGVRGPGNLSARHDDYLYGNEEPR